MRSVFIVIICTCEVSELSEVKCLSIDRDHSIEALWGSLLLFTGALGQASSYYVGQMHCHSPVLIVSYTAPYMYVSKYFNIVSRIICKFVTVSCAAAMIIALARL